MFKILDLIQGTPEWLEYRRSKITATDVPAILKKDPYNTPLKIYENKAFGITDEITPHQLALFQKAHEAEKTGREFLNKKLNLRLEPMVLESLKLSDLMASLDGFDRSKNVIFEAKFMGQKNFEKVKDGEPLPQHKIQMQAQLFVTGADKCIYFCMDGASSVLIEEYPDEDIFFTIEEEIKKFLELLRAGKSPEPTEDDFVRSDDPRFEKLFQIKQAREQLDQHFEALKRELTDEFLKTNRRIKGSGVVLSKSFFKGPIEYEKIEKLKGIDIEKYRSPGDIDWKRVSDELLSDVDLEKYRAPGRISSSVRFEKRGGK